MATEVVDWRIYRPEQSPERPFAVVSLQPMQSRCWVHGLALPKTEAPSPRRPRWLGHCASRPTSSSAFRSVKADDRADDPEMWRLWKKFQLVATLPDKDQRALIRLIHSLARSESD